jgi:predicted phage terminase large subunit-like protein
MSLLDDIAACDVESVKTGGLRAFTRLTWPHVYPTSPLQWNWHLDLLIDHYEAGIRGEIRKLVVNLPPGGSKSSLTSVFFPAWDWTVNPGHSWIFAAYGQKIVRRDAELWKQLIQSPWFQRRWGKGFQIPGIPAIDLIKNDKGGFRLGTTPGGEVTGFHGNVHVYDDPNKPEELTKVGLAGVQDWHARTMGTRWRRPPEINFEACIMQRLHCDDLAQKLIDQGAVHICLPANFDPSRRTVTKWGMDPRTEQGELLDPIRLPQVLINEMRANLGAMNASAQLDQNPVPEGGAIFKRVDLRFWSNIPQSIAEGVIFPDGTKCPCVMRPEQYEQRINSWDMAFKDEKTSDYVAGQAWDRCGSGLFLLDQIHGHLAFAASMAGVVALAMRWPGTSAKLIEDKANGSGIVSMLTTTIPGIIAVNPEGGKFARACACSPFFEAHNVFLPDPNMPGYEWVWNLIVEIMSFPRGKHDDQVDAMSQALLYLQVNASYLKAAMDAIRKSNPWGHWQQT